MKKELQDKIYKEFYPIFEDRHKPMSETCMCWGLCVGDGWFDLLWKLCEDIKKALTPEEWKKFRVHQVKQKFAGLRFYSDYHTEIEDIIRVAEEASYETCEACGKPGRMVGDCYVQTLCEECSPIKKEKKKDGD